MTEETGGQLNLFDRDSWSGKTCPGHSQATAEKTFKKCLRKFAGSATKTPPTCLCLKGGVNQGVYMMSWADGQLLGEYTMRSFGECPKEERESHLSQILEECAPRKYYLSAKACAGILRRAKQRGKELPAELREALEKQSLFKSGTESPGGGKGILIQRDHVGALSTVNNQYTLQGVKNHTGFDAYQHGGYRENETCGTLSARQGALRGDTPLVLDNAYASSSFGQYKKGVGTLRAHGGGDTGGGGETLVVCNAVDFRNDRENSKINGTLQASPRSIQSNNVIRTAGIVRRLTPLECERLQGFPDGWTDIGEWVDSNGRRRESADTLRYKALGNSIALPFWFYLLRRIAATYERPATLGSLFDGIGGFPLCWERCNGKGSALWASEIEEFPIAVTKHRFPE